MQFSTTIFAGLLAAAANAAPAPVVGAAMQARQNSQDFCGASPFYDRYDERTQLGWNLPKVSDCQRLAENVANDGNKWEVTSSPTNIASSGTCTFRVSLGSASNEKVYIGNKDVADIILTSISRYTHGEYVSTQGYRKAKLDAQNTMQCGNNGLETDREASVNWDILNFL
ncbi:unnamed protein product [Cercospora beticola]|nr:unnamed protein product [Cercospora beticola]